VLTFGTRPDTEPHRGLHSAEVARGPAQTHAKTSELKKKTKKFQKGKVEKEEEKKHERRTSELKSA
jgi:hypothetical protein